LDTSAWVPPARQRRRHTYAELFEIRSRRATSDGVTPAANQAAACIRTASRLSRARADKPPPSGYLMIPEYAHERSLAARHAASIIVRLLAFQLL
jgi:hypothetical protein